MTPRSRLGWLHASVAGLLLAGYCGAFLHSLGVSVADQLRYVTYLVVVTYAPGVALASRVWGAKIGVLRLACVGAGLGYALEGFTFLGLGPLHARWLWPWYPAVGIAALLHLAWQWRAATAPPRLDRFDSAAGIWSKAVLVGSVVTVYATYLAYLGSVGSRFSLIPVGPDLFWHLAVAAELKHHWPVAEPHLSGFSFSYHYLSHAHMAAASIITGIDLQVLLLRLYLPPLLTLAALNVCVLTRVLARSAVVEAFALLMVFFSGTVDLAYLSGPVLTQLWSGGAPVDVGDPWAFVGNGFFSGISPSLVYGLVMFLPLVAESIVAVRQGPASRFRIVVIAVLMAGSMLAKGSFMPVFGAGMTVGALWLWWTGRAEWKNAAGLVVLAVLVCTPVYFAFLHQYWQGGSTPPVFKPFEIVKYTDVWLRFEPVIRSLWQSGAVKGVPDLTFRGVALLAVAGIVVIYFIVSFATRLLGILYFAGRNGLRMSANKVVMSSLILASLAPAYLLLLVDFNQLHFLNAAYPLAGILAAGGLGHLILRKRASPVQRFGQVVAVAALLVSTWNSAYAFSTTYRNRHVADVVSSSHIVFENSDAYAAQRWIRANTAETSILAVSLFAEGAAQFRRRCDYSAFSERRLLIEGEHYLRGRDPQELAARRELLAAVVRRGEASALDTLKRRFGVTHLVVDTSDEQAVTLPSELAAPLFQSGTVSVYGVGADPRQ